MTFTSRRVALPTGISLHVREQGEGGPTTLLLHGWAVSGVVWEPVLASWPAHAGRVIVPDLRGTGFSQKPREGYTLEDDVRDVVALIDTLGLTDVVLVGHSKGGAIAQRVALERPAALRKLVLVCSVPASGIPFPDADAAFFRSLCGPREGAAQILGLMIKKPVPAAVLDHQIDAMASVAIESLLGGFDAFRTANFADQIGGIKTSTLVIGGAAEHVITPAMLQQLVVDPIPGATLALIPECGHYPQFEATHELVELLVAAGGGHAHHQHDK